MLKKHRRSGGRGHNDQSSSGNVVKPRAKSSILEIRNTRLGTGVNMTQINSREIKEWATSPESHPNGINCAQVESIEIAYPNEQKLLQMVHNRAGYKTTASAARNMRGVININFAEKALPLEAMTDKEVEAHILGVIMVEHYSMKKGIDLFGDRAETAVTKELKKDQQYEHLRTQACTGSHEQREKGSVGFFTIHH